MDNGGREHTGRGKELEIGRRNIEVIQKNIIRGTWIEIGQNTRNGRIKYGDSKIGHATGKKEFMGDFGGRVMEDCLSKGR